MVPSRALGPAAAAALLLTTAAAQQGLRLVRVPDPLVLPAPAGSNPLLEVQAPDAAERVWLTAVDGDGAAVPLVAAGGDRWQLNLADARVTRIARREDCAGLRVHAQVGDRRVASAVIAFARPRATAAPLRCTAFLAGSAEPRELTPAGRHWLDPAAVDRVEVAARDADIALLARMGSTDRPLVRRPGGFALTVDPAVALAWRQAGQLELVVQRGADRAVACRIRAIPAALDLPDGGSRVTVVQRKSAAVPGSRGYLRIALGDITAGQVLLTVQGADGRELVPQVSLRERDRAEFALGDERYAVLVETLENLLIGDDYAELRVLPAQDLPRDPIAELLRAIEAADVTFVREGREFGGRVAALHVRKKLAALGREPSVDEFVDRVASRSSTTGSDYEVVLEDGTRQPMRAWLRARLRELDAAAAEAERGDR